MAYANNRAAAKPRASFQVAGGTVIKFRHPELSGQISGASPVDEIDVSRALRLNDTFFDAQPAQDSAFQETLVDGSVITVTNHLMNGSVTLQVLPTTGFVGTGDLIAAAHLIIASKDDTGGTLTVVQFLDGKRRTTVFYGVAFKNVPHLRLAGNAVIPYPIVMTYAGWIQGVSANTDANEKTIWAVGNKYGIKGVYKPYAIQQAENEGNFYGGNPMSDTLAGVGNGDTSTGDIAAIAAIPEVLPVGISDTPSPETVTWEAAEAGA
jgi:hypothetical protein